jgi:hypothetical protein
MWATDCPAGQYERITIAFNQRGMDPLKDFMRTKVATHEFGHALGLAHPSDNLSSNRSTKSIMYQGVLSYNVPQTYDKDLIRKIYK